MYTITHSNKELIMVFSTQFSVLIPAALVLLDFQKKSRKKCSVFQTMTLTLYNL